MTFEESGDFLVLGIVIIFFILLAIFFVKYFRGDWIKKTRIPL